MVSEWDSERHILVILPQKPSCFHELQGSNKNMLNYFHTNKSSCVAIRGPLTICRICECPKRTIQAERLCHRRHHNVTQLHSKWILERELTLRHIYLDVRRGEPPNFCFHVVPHSKSSTTFTTCSVSSSNRAVFPS